MNKGDETSSERKSAAQVLDRMTILMEVMGEKVDRALDQSKSQTSDLKAFKAEIRAELRAELDAAKKENAAEIAAMKRVVVGDGTDQNVGVANRVRQNSAEIESFKKLRWFIFSTFAVAVMAIVMNLFYKSTGLKP